MDPLEAQLRQGIETSLRLRIEENAVFLAERLFAEFPSQSSLLKVVDAYRANGDSSTALRLLRNYHPFSQLLPESSNSSSSSSTNNNIRNQQQQQVIFVGSPRYNLHYLHGTLAARAHQYPEAERILSPLLNCPISNNNNNNDDSNTAEAADSEDSQAGVKYWLGVCGCHQGEAAKSRPSTLFGEAVQTTPLLFCAFQEGIKRCEPLAQEQSYYNVYNSNNNSNEQNSDAASSSQKTILKEKRNQYQQLSNFLQPFGEIIRRLYGSYNCNSALNILQPSSTSNNNSCEENNNNTVPELTLSIQQKFSGWCLEHQAMSFFHSGRTQDAVATFEQLRQREPWRLNTPAMVYYSTCLWHSKQEVALCALAQKMIDTIPKSPFTLSVVGNCHSLNRDSRTAATMFHRATCLDPSFAYAHTLRGHELLGVEEVGDAEDAFYEALKWDRRHYAAFAGLGETYFRLEKEGPARENFRAALKINATLPAVLCRLAATYHRVGATQSDLEIALSLYEASLQRCPSHLPSHQQRAAILVRLNRLQEAQELLLKLISECPEEPSLHVTYGKCMAKLGNQDAAVKSFHKAMDLDPRRQASIRVLLDRVAAKKDVENNNVAAAAVPV